MRHPTTIVAATGNRGKLAEIKSFLADAPVILKGLDDFPPIPSVEEDGDTFDENAYKKASFTARVLGLPALADDSGLVVEALNGAPGVLSARYAGENPTTERLCARALENMKGKTNRKAAFECVISIAVPTGPALTYEGRCEGLLTEAPAGENGFGYDPVFFHGPLGKTFGQMTMEEKAGVSHRGRALAEIKSEIDKILVWIEQNMPVPETFECVEK
ncbi:dITP/XTP pyrophosphatase [Candidatus Desulfarcum epimagneticum]|uniref:dITP/XTP pyrophosphatase n=1 Tax=uncultured Desulfobacteraceae bacterium TaxID=218296 RepID=A0A484HJR9_9BACT|nr:dITP/XTP pyrophosphatase [uncultured Desulfobacteraceae bacterium]